MPETTQIRRLDQRPLQQAISTRDRSFIPGLTKDEVIKWFFGSNAWVAIIVLGLIMLSLFSQSIGFNPTEGFFGQNYRNLLVYRLAGLEFVDLIKKETTGLDQVSTYLADVRLREFKRLVADSESQGKTEDQALTDANTALGPFDDYAGKVSGLSGDLNDIISNLGDTATATKTAFKIIEDKKTEKRLYLDAGKTDLADKVTWQDVDVAAATKPLLDAIPSIKDANTKFVAGLSDLLNTPPPALNATMATDMAGFNSRVQDLINAIPADQKAIEEWNPNVPVPWYAGITNFFTNPQWLVASSWQDYYGIIPLFVGSLLISVVALAIAIPLGVGAGVYINQIATPLEQNTIKPAIEFISAIPSVVLGFFGVAILGESIRAYSHDGLLYFVSLILPQSWIDGMPGWLHSILGFSFIPPFAERLNVLTAGILLAFMAIPTIFTLTEDALNNVPRAFKEASYALGANRLQTIVRIILPAALSGVISAVLLGFGRVIGETMVVLLCAGNRIAIPKMSDGLMVLFQPVHTMTGIIAQELGEAENGSIEWHALFMVGLMLFIISLAINFGAQRVVQKFKLSIG
jgi:phosphate transport system permease protein